MKTAILPGSFDPVTEGHADIIRRAAKIFGKAEVVVMNNPDKEYIFSLDERYELCRAAFSGEDNITVEKSEGMLCDYVRGREAVIVKGLRDPRDAEYERKMSVFNLAHSGVETVYLDSSDALCGVSSTLVRKTMSEKGELSGLVPEKIVKIIVNKL